MAKDQIVIAGTSVQTMNEGVGERTTRAHPRELNLKMGIIYMGTSVKETRFLEVP